MILLLGLDGKIVTNSNNIVETDDHYIINNCGFMRGSFKVVEIEAEEIPEDMTHYHDDKFSSLSIEETLSQKSSILKQLEESDTQLIRLIDDLMEFCETKGFIPHALKKDLVDQRKTLRQDLSEL